MYDYHWKCFTEATHGTLLFQIIAAKFFWTSIGCILSNWNKQVIVAFHQCMEFCRVSFMQTSILATTCMHLRWLKCPIIKLKLACKSMLVCTVCKWGQGGLSIVCIGDTVWWGYSEKAREQLESSCEWLPSVFGQSLTYPVKTNSNRHNRVLWKPCSNVTLWQYMFVPLTQDLIFILLTQCNRVLFSLGKKPADNGTRIASS